MSLRRAAARFLPHVMKQINATSKLSNNVLPIYGIAPVCVIPSSWPKHHSFASSSAAQGTLVDVLRNEIEYERQNYSQPEDLAGGPPAPFTLTETQGDTLMILSRQYGPETVNVELSVNDQPEEEPFETEEGALDVDVGVIFTAHVVKGDATLVFECKTDGSYLSIMHASVEPSSGEIDDTAYTGPVFEELDEELQRHFVTFLEERGVTADLGSYLLRLVHDKEQREYMYWLERVHAIVKS